MNKQIERTYRCTLCGMVNDWLDDTYGREAHLQMTHRITERDAQRFMVMSGFQELPKVTGEVVRL